MKKPVALIILDGFALIEKVDGNAVKYAKKPNFDSLYSKYPVSSLGASGFDVGLPEGQMGNSEVGHLNIGAGRIVYQELTRITKAIKDGDFFENEELVRAMENARDNRALHLMGLVSDGGVHSHIDHLKGLIEMAHRYGVKDVYVHCFMDGRDTPPRSGSGFIKELEDFMTEKGTGKIATISGRYYAMDRDNRWDRVQKAYDAVVRAQAPHAESSQKAMEESYKNDKTDEFVEPVVVLENYEGLKDKDSVIFFNFRPDRARELTNAITEDSFDGFEREKIDTLYITMTQYDARFSNVSIAYKPQTLTNTMGEYLSKKGLTQLRIAETEKYAHVTFFFNGGREEPFAKEERILINSPKVATYDLQPEMSAYEVKDALVAEIKKQKHDFIVVNYANGDMVGHTGVYKAIETAVKAVDKCLEETIETAKANGYEAIIIADHGNADNALNADGSENTAHSLNPVPFVYITEKKNTSVKNGILADVAPSILTIMGIPQPKEMTGKTLID